jgi:hypothetical protein
MWICPGNMSLYQRHVPLAMNILKQHVRNVTGPGVETYYKNSSNNNKNHIAQYQYFDTTRVLNSRRTFNLQHASNISNVQCKYLAAGVKVDIHDSCRSMMADVFALRQTQKFPIPGLRKTIRDARD